MSDFVFPPVWPVSVPVQGDARRFAVSRIFCVGRNYAAHAREMGADPSREPPFFFTKNPLHLNLSGSHLPYPPGTADLHHEVELVLALGREAYRISPQEALDCVWGYACGLDMTRRDLQAAAKQGGKPWAFGKDFAGGAIISPIVPASQCGHLSQGAISLHVNGQLRQSGDLADQIWRVPEVVANLSQFYRLQAGDLIYTGTPEGVGAVQPGDVLHGRIEGLGEISLHIAPPL